MLILFTLQDSAFSMIHWKLEDIFMYTHSFIATKMPRDVLSLCQEPADENVWWGLVGSQCVTDVEA